MAETKNLEISRGEIFHFLEGLGVKDFRTGNRESPENRDENTRAARERFAKKWRALGATARVRDEEYFPKKLLEQSPPAVLSGVGDRSLLGKKLLGIVGPRAMSAEGARLVRGLLDAGRGRDFVTVSGFADGVDSLVHEKSLELGVPTVAILGEGLGVARAGRKRDFLQKIVDAGGLVLAEMKFGARATKYSFPMRNRLIAGLAEKLFVPEAGLKSGSLNTVERALKFGVPVWTAPHSLRSGANAGLTPLLEAGEIQVFRSFEKFWEDWGGENSGGNSGEKSLENSAKQRAEMLAGRTESERAVLEKLGEEKSFEKLAGELGWESAELMGVLTLLELEGLAVEVRPGVWTS